VEKILLRRTVFGHRANILIEDHEDYPQSGISLLGDLHHRHGVLDVGTKVLLCDFAFD
jgi:hypothetical protein